MAYRNKTYVAFASEDISYYRLMEAWKKNTHIDFNFFNAHDLYLALDTSQPDTIRRRLRERLNNSKQIVMLVSNYLKKKSCQSNSFLYYEIETIKKLNLPVVFANLNQSRISQNENLPSQLSELYTISVSFQPNIIQYALDNYCEQFSINNDKKGPYYYKQSLYEQIGL
ncbi:TPA: molecular chaperone Tir [Legionella pneumophila subsp. pneumophila]|nr:molecular chaperone Tir [Legionella pneumophila subsp. pneumophila]HCC3234324.1 TIR domain-containing protein [Legionella pneumophila subsp. pneumophila]